MSHISIKDKVALSVSSRENVHSILRKEKILQNSVYTIRLDLFRGKGIYIWGFVHIYMCVCVCVHLKNLGKCHKLMIMVIWVKKIE